MEGKGSSRKQSWDGESVANREEEGGRSCEVDVAQGEGEGEGEGDGAGEV